MRIETPRLLITDFTPEMAKDVHLGSLDADTRRFLPDEVFETEQEAADVIRTLIECSAGSGPFVYPMLAGGEYAGYVQLAPADDGWEIGYHTVRRYTGQGFATEAVQAFLPWIMQRLSLQEVLGICDAQNAASVRVLEKCGFRQVYRGLGPYQGREREIVRMVYRQ